MPKYPKIDVLFSILRSRLGLVDDFYRINKDVKRARVYLKKAIELANEITKKIDREDVERKEIFYKLCSDIKNYCIKLNINIENE